MNDDTDDEVNLLIDFEQDITTIRLIDSTLLPSQLKIRAEVLPTESLTNEESFDAAITKIRFWFEAVVSRCVIFHRRNPHAIKMLIGDNGENNTSNPLMTTPGEPTDEHLAALFQAKMTALSSGHLVFGAVEIKSDNMPGLVYRFVGNAEDIMPSNHEWVGARSYFEMPWWERDDASTLDVVPAPDADLSTKPAWAYSLDFLSQATKSQKGVMMRPDFRPHVIDGGKKDD